jgi:hypothetical protein
MKQTPKPAAAPERKLTNFQQIICDLAGDLIFNGGKQVDAEELLHALASHQWNRQFGTLESWVSGSAQFAEKRQEDWYKLLISGLPAERVEMSHPQPKSFAGHLNLRVQDQVRRSFEDFMSDATPHELMMIRDMLAERNNDVPLLANGEAVEEVPLAAAIDSMLRRYDHTYVRVPDETVKLVRELVATRQQLEKSEDCA